MSEAPASASSAPAPHTRSIRTVEQGASLRELIDHCPNNLDAMRLVAAVLVVVGHCYALAIGSTQAFPYGDITGDPIFRLTRGQIFGGTLGVDFFFLISGFLVTRSWLRCRDSADYLWRRALRLCPAFFAVSLLGGLLIGPLAAASREAYASAFELFPFLKSVALLQQPHMPAVFLENPYPGEHNGSLWTLRYEATCYLLVAVLGLMGAYRARVVPLVLFLGFWLVWVLQTHGWPGILPEVEIYPFGILSLWPNLATFFLAGMALYLWSSVVPYSRWLFALSLVLLALFTWIGWLSAVLPVCGSYAVFYLAFQSWRAVRALVARADLSYGIYLYAFPLQQGLLALAPETFVRAPLLLLAAVLPLSAVCAFASWSAIEKPALRFKGALRSAATS